MYIAGYSSLVPCTCTFLVAFLPIGARSKISFERLNIGVSLEVVWMLLATRNDRPMLLGTFLSLPGRVLTHFGDRENACYCCTASHKEQHRTFPGAEKPALKAASVVCPVFLLPRHRISIVGARQKTHRGPLTYACPSAIPKSESKVRGCTYLYIEQ